MRPAEVDQEALQQHDPDAAEPLAGLGQHVHPIAAAQAGLPMVNIAMRQVSCRSNAGITADSASSDVPTAPETATPTTAITRPIMTETGSTKPVARPISARCCSRPALL